MGAQVIDSREFLARLKPKMVVTEDDVSEREEGDVEYWLKRFRRSEGDDSQSEDE